MIDQRFAALADRIRSHHRDCGTNGEGAEILRELELLQSELAELLRRMPDLTPASITVIAH